MAYDIQTDFGPDSRTTTTNAPGFSLAPGTAPTLPTMDLSFLQDELKRRMLADRQLVDLQRSAMMRRLMGSANDERSARAQANAPMMSAAGDPNAAQRQATEAEQLRAAMMQAQAMTQQAPMRMVTGAGITPGYTMDTNAMSGAQRQVFLPQNSSNDPVADAQARNMGVSGNVLGQEAWNQNVRGRRQTQFDPYDQQRASANNAYYGR